MNRRTFLKSTAISTIAFGTNPWPQALKTHILTLSFDDGFKKSFYKIAEIYEAYGLRACLNVIASGHKRSFKQVDNWIRPELMGNFDDWNALKARGHEIMPHSWKHLNLTRQPLKKSKKLILKCLRYFENHLEGYKSSEAVFNFPFNASTPELEAFTLSKVLALRSHGNTPINAMPTNGPYRQACWSHGPDNSDSWVEDQVNDFLAAPGGWLILNLHGLEDEGWGPLSTRYLDDLLSRMVKVEQLEILPAGEVLLRSKS